MLWERENPRENGGKQVTKAGGEQQHLKALLSWSKGSTWDSERTKFDLRAETSKESNLIGWM